MPGAFSFQPQKSSEVDAGQKHHSAEKFDEQNCLQI